MVFILVFVYCYFYGGFFCIVVVLLIFKSNKHCRVRKTFFNCIIIQIISLDNTELFMCSETCGHLILKGQEREIRAIGRFIAAILLYSL